MLSTFIRKLYRTQGIDPVLLTRAATVCSTQLKLRGAHSEHHDVMAIDYEIDGNGCRKTRLSQWHIAL